MRKRKILYCVLLLVLVVWLAAPLFLDKPGVSVNPLRRTIFALPADGDISAVLVDDGRTAELNRPEEVLNGLKYWFYILNPDVLFPMGDGIGVFAFGWKKKAASMCARTILWKLDI